MPPLAVLLHWGVVALLSVAVLVVPVSHVVCVQEALVVFVDWLLLLWLLSLFPC